MLKRAMRWAVIFGAAIGMSAATLIAPAASAQEEVNGKSIRIEALIDGRSQLIIHDGTAQWYHLDFAAPGRHEFVNKPTIINGVKWFPKWPDVPDTENRDCHCTSNVFHGVSPQLPVREATISLRLIQSRYETKVAQHPTVANDYTLIIEFDDNPVGGSQDYIIEILFTRRSTPPILFASTTTAGAIDGMAYRNEDILGHRLESGGWFKLFDGSDVGLGGNNVDAFSLMDDGSLLLSLAQPQTLDGVGQVNPQDIVRFVPTSLGGTTQGHFEWYLHGSDAGLTTAGENVDAIGWTADYRLVISTSGSFSVRGSNGVEFTGRDEDLIAANDGSFSTWQMYFDGGDVRLADREEDVRSVWIEPVSGRLYLTVKGALEIGEISGSASDVFACTPLALGARTRCTFNVFWRGDDHGLGGQPIDGLEFGFYPSSLIDGNAPADVGDGPMFEEDTLEIGE